MENSFVLYGTSISHGIAIGKPYFLIEKRKRIISKSLAFSDVDREIDRYRGALDKSKHDLEHLQKRYIKDGASVVVEILDAHLEILHDPIITQIVEEKIKQNLKNTEAVFNDVLDEYKKGFQNLDDDFVVERIKDIKDVSKRILSHLNPFSQMEERVKNIGNSIVIAEDLIPSDTLDSKFDGVLAFVTQKGGYASHAAIISRAKGVPFVTKIDMQKLMSAPVDNLIVDGINGKILVNPSQKVIDEYLHLQKVYKKYIADIMQNDSFDPITKDNVRISLLANIESKEDLPLVYEKKADGIGLFRSEYLFLTEKVLPTEERQFEIYKEILMRSEGKDVTIRLFDIGGDKNYFIVDSGRSSLKLQLCKNEQNPVLGCRGIRFLLKNENIFENQLRALLRASVYGKLKILIPLISDVMEMRLVREKIKTLKDILQKEGKKVSDNILLGCMLEVPSAVIMVDTLAREVDFFSIGTNDLTQYVMASDRANCDTGYLYDFSHPAILRLIKLIVDTAKKYQKEVSICGEMASDIKFTKILLGMGIRSFSVAARRIPFLKNEIIKTSIKSVVEKASKAEADSETSGLTSSIFI